MNHHPILCYSDHARLLCAYFEHPLW